MVVFDPVYRIKVINTNIFGAIVSNYSEGFYDYDFSRMMMSKFRCSAINLSRRIDDGGNFEEGINEAYDEHMTMIDILKENKSI